MVLEYKHFWNRKEQSLTAQPDYPGTSKKTSISPLPASFSLCVVPECRFSQTLKRNTDGDCSGTVLSQKVSKIADACGRYVCISAWRTRNSRWCTICSNDFPRSSMIYSVFYFASCVLISLMYLICFNCLSWFSPLSD